VVQTRSVLVRVLGTSFTVRAFADQPTAEVSVRTGRVSVSPADGKSNRTRPGIVLIPNEKATLTVAGNRLAKSLVTQPVVLNPKAVTNQFVFAGTGLRRDDPVRPATAGQLHPHGPAHRSAIVYEAGHGLYQHRSQLPPGRHHDCRGWGRVRVIHNG
jgi:hypothetical protein